MKQQWAGEGSTGSTSMLSEVCHSSIASIAKNMGDSEEYKNRKVVAKLCTLIDQLRPPGRTTHTPDHR